MDDNKKGSSNHKSYPTLFGKILHMLIILLLLSMISWVILLMWATAHAYSHSLNTLIAKIEFISKTNLEILTERSNRQINTIVIKFNHVQDLAQIYITLFFQWLEERLHRVHYQAALNSQISIITISAVVFGTLKIICYRLAILLLSLPLLCSFMFVAIVDGLSQRDIRKFVAAKESTFFFHRIAPLVEKLFYLFFVIFLCIPFVLPINLLLIPMTLLLSYLTMLTIKNYKKYA